MSQSAKLLAVCMRTSIQIPSTHVKSWYQQCAHNPNMGSGQAEARKSQGVIQATQPNLSSKICERSCLQRIK